MLTHHQQVTEALDLLTRGMGPYVENALETIYRERWAKVVRESFRKDRVQIAGDGNSVTWDAHSLLTVTWDQWNSVFRHKLGHTERSLVSELREFRNQWAHQGEFGFDDAYRVLDSVQRLLEAMSADEAKQVAYAKRELLRKEFNNEIQLAGRNANVTSRKFSSVSIYVACCGVIVAVLVAMFGSPARFIAGAFVIFFGYLSYKTIVSQPYLFGPHECAHCSKIIYSECCPYCEVHKMVGTPG